MKKFMFFVLILLTTLIFSGCNVEKLPDNNEDKESSVKLKSFGFETENSTDNQVTQLITKNIIVNIEDTITYLTVELDNPEKHHIEYIIFNSSGMNSIISNDEEIPMDGQNYVEWRGISTEKTKFQVKLDPNTQVGSITISEIIYLNRFTLENEKANLVENDQTNVVTTYVLDCSVNVTKVGEDFENAKFKIEITDNSSKIKDLIINVKDLDGNILKYFVLTPDVLIEYSPDGTYIRVQKYKINNLFTVYGSEINFKPFNIEVKFDITGYDAIKDTSKYSSRTNFKLDEDIDLMPSYETFVDFRILKNLGDASEAFATISSPYNEDFLKTTILELYIENNDLPIAIFNGTTNTNTELKSIYYNSEDVDNLNKFLDLYNYISLNLGSPIYYVLKTPNGRIVFEKTQINYYYWDNRVVGEIFANSNLNE